MSRRLDDYLGRVAHQLRALPQAVRENEVREMRAHLEQLIEDGMASGHNPEAATNSALMQFGEARGVGIGVRDVWEGQKTGWKPVLTAFFVGLLFWGGAMSSLSLGMARFQIWEKSALFPYEMHFALFAGFALVPFLTATIHARYLGRRAWMMSAALYLSQLATEFVSITPPSSVSYGDYQTSFWAWNLLWGVAGAVLSAYWMRRRRYALLALAGATSSASLADVSLPRQSRRSLSRKTLVILAVLLALSLGVKWRLDSAQHAHSAADAVHIRLVTTRDTSEMEFPDPIRLWEVEPTPAEERAGVRRVRFEARCRMTRDYQQRRIAFVRSQLALPRARRGWNEENLRASLRRATLNNYHLHGVAKVKNTPDGWKIAEDDSFDWSRLWGWAEDISFED